MNWHFALGCFWVLMILVWGVVLVDALVTGQDYQYPAIMQMLSLVLSNQAFREASNA